MLRLSSGYRVKMQIICIVIRLPVLVRQWVTNHNIFLGLSYLTKETLHFLSRLARIKFTCSATSGNRRGEEIQKKFVRARSKKLPSSWMPQVASGPERVIQEKRKRERCFHFTCVSWLAGDLWSSVHASLKRQCHGISIAASDLLYSPLSPSLFPKSSPHPRLWKID